MLFGLFAVPGWGVTRFSLAVLLAISAESDGMAMSSLVARFAVSGWGVAWFWSIVLPGISGISDCVARFWSVVLYNIVNSTLCMLGLTASAPTCSVISQLVQSLNSPCDQIPACAVLNRLQIPLALLGQGKKD